MENILKSQYPSRSVLFNIEPLGLGTPYVESLSSYISRLARYHCLSTGTLFSKLIAIYLNKYYITEIAGRGGDGFYDSSNGVNGIGSLAIDFVEVIEFLTSRNNISKLTFLPWSSILPTRGLMETKKKWCPFCYEDSLANQSEVYDPLIWSLKESKYCLKHKVTLVSTCNRCYRKINFLSRDSNPGFCHSCKSWLGSHTETFYNEIEPLDMKIGNSERIGEMLEISSGVRPINIRRSQVGEALNFYLNSCFKGDLKAFAHVLETPITTFRYWQKGINLPPLRGLLKICLNLDIGLLDFIEMKHIEIHSYENKVFSQTYTKEIKKYDHDKVKAILMEEITNPKGTSLSQLAKVIGCDRKLLYIKFPNESKQIVDNNKSNLMYRKIERRVTSEEKLLKAIKNLLDKDLYPSRRRVEHELDGEILLKESHFRAIWNQMIKNL
ncbi:TniQ family protein [Bacillus luteolus]|uniref:TniQ family protein n=1 Tax=Litchfieldia luteola TaxID=682179 RepID=A0ABR9QEP4_9BACI|nr:TniQ family protein [Cytobacillus luteolus]MBE4906945.1 TniQ family protein [Cytobacillus luteolus]MBP1943590.1 hypothetical protein [Cytobacillus luteolus]